LEMHPAIVPVTKVKETLRQMHDDESQTIDRNLYRLVQTPQCFHREVLATAYEQEFDSAFTDDASVVERTGVSIFLVEGNEENIKLTTPLDMQLAELLLKTQEV